METKLQYRNLVVSLSMCLCLNLSLRCAVACMVWEIRLWQSAKPIVKQRTDALPSGLFLLLFTPTSMKALQLGKITSLKPSSACANCYKNTRLGVWGNGGVDRRWRGGGRGILIIQCSARNSDLVLSVVPCRSTNFSASKWRFIWGNVIL